MVSILDFDVFRRPPSDLYERGTVGGFGLTLLSAFILMCLMTWHTYVFLAVPTKTTDLVVQKFRKHRVMIDISVDLKMPCPLIDLEVHNSLGTYTLDATRNISKHRLDSRGETIKEGDATGNLVHRQEHVKAVSGSGVHQTYFDDSHPQLDALGEGATEVVESMVNAQEWCRINGTIVVAKMPGKVFVHSHHVALAQNVTKFMAAKIKTDKWYNTSHLIHRFRFLDFENPPPIPSFQLAHEAFAKMAKISETQSAIFNAFNLFLFPHKQSAADLTYKTMTEPSINWRYDLQVVGTQLRSGVESYDFSLGDYSYAAPADATYDGHAEPLSLSYTFSPLTIVHKETYQSTLSYLSSVLASLGGCFALLKLLDNSIFVGRHLTVKHRAGKIV